MDRPFSQRKSQSLFDSDWSAFGSNAAPDPASSGRTGSATCDLPSDDAASSPWTLLESKLRSVLSPDEFAAWIAPLAVGFREPNTLVITVPNLVFYQGLMDAFLGIIEGCKSELGLDRILLAFRVDGSQDDLNLLELPSTASSEIEEALGYDLPSPHENPLSPTGGLGSSPSTTFDESSTNSSLLPRWTSLAPSSPSGAGSPLSSALAPPRAHLNSLYTFDNFVRGPSNQFAFASCCGVAANPGKAYNPLFIYGSTGLGKTHLLHAVGNFLLKSNPTATVTYISSEQFMNEMIYCLRFNKMWDFRQKYRFCDLFLVDDIQFISGKERTQEEFFHTFNTLYESKRQIVITSDRFPQDIPDIQERLRNRFQWGLIADIQIPDVTHRIAILNSKAQAAGILLPDDVAHYIATMAKRNVRELEGALHRIKAFAALHGRPIDMDLVARTFENVPGDPPKRLSIETIQRVVSEHYKIRLNDLKSKRRQRALTLPRQVAMYLAREIIQASFPEIGERFGGKDHTTVMHAVRKIETDRQTDLDLKAHLDALSRKLEQLA